MPLIDPYNLVATPYSASRVDVSWDGGAGYDEAQIERKVAGGSYSVVKTLGPVAHYWADTTVADGLQYYYRLRCYSSSEGYSDYTNEDGAITPLHAPSSFNAIATGPTTATLTWNNNAANATSVRIYKNGVYQYSVSDTAESEDFTGLSADTTYSFYVKAYNTTAGASDASNTDSITTPPNPPTAPSTLILTGLTDSSCKLDWTDNSNNEVDFHIERKVEGGSYSQIDTVAANVKTYTDETVPPGYTYYYRVRAHNTGGYSSYLTAKRYIASILTESVTPVESFVAGLEKVLTEEVTPTEYLSIQPDYKLTELVTPTETFFIQKISGALAGDALVLVARTDHKLYLFDEGVDLGLWDSKDIVFGLPGLEETLCEIRFWGLPLTPSSVTVKVSTNCGATWTTVGAATLDSSRVAKVFPWITGTRFRIRFQAYGVHLSGFSVYAIPRSREGLPT